MRNLNKIATAVAISLTVGLAATAYAHQGEGSGMGPGAQGGQHQGMQGGMMGHGQMQGKGQRMGGNHGTQGHGHGGSQAGQQLMTPEERTAMLEKMHSAKTPEERQQIAAANRAEMQKRATEKGITLPEHRGPHGHAGMGPFAPKAPVTPESAQ